MQAIYNFFVDNKEWLFSGAGIAIITVAYKVFSSKGNNAKSNKQKSKMFAFGCNNKLKNNQKNE